MSRPRAHAFVALSAVLSLGSHATADAGAFLGDSSRVAALAGAASARPGDAASLHTNPAGLADLSGAELAVLAQLARLEHWFARDGEAREDRSRTLGGFGLAVGARLPGPDWLRRFRFGFALHTPAEHALRVRAPERLDEPESPFYDGRPDKLGALGALAVEVLPSLRVGVALSVAPTLHAPSDVTYVAGRGSGPEEDVEIRLERDLRFGLAPLVGIRAQPLDALSLALVYRGENASVASGRLRVVAGGILADDPVRFRRLWSPEQFVFGAHARVSSRLSLSADLTWSRFSRMRDGYDRPLAEPFHDVLSPAAGGELAVASGSVLRAGYALEPSPIPEQVGDTNYLGATTHVLAVGVGHDFANSLAVPLRLDLHGRGRIDARQSARKDPARLSDADPEAPGTQVTNLGYPGFESRALLVQLGLTLTVALDAAAWEAAR